MKNQPGTMKNHGNQPKTMKNHETTLKAGQGRNNQKRHVRGVTTDLLDVKIVANFGYFVANSRTCWF